MSGAWSLSLCFISLLIRDLAPLSPTHKTLTDRVTIVEVSPRDGLQNEKALLPSAVKVELVDRLSAAGCATIEVTSFVSSKAIPQLADAADVMAGIRRAPGVRYTVLVPNLKGFERAIATRPDGIVVFGAASETFSQRNINCSIAESIERFRPVVTAARAAGIPVRGGCLLRHRDAWLRTSDSYRRAPRGAGNRRDAKLFSGLL